MFIAPSIVKVLTRDTKPPRSSAATTEEPAMVAT
jgi:hypothetical protein